MLINSAHYADQHYDQGCRRVGGIQPIRDTGNPDNFVLFAIYRPSRFNSSIMSNSLKDQLLALGLAPKKTGGKPNKPGKPKNPVNKRQPKTAEISLDQAYKIRVREERLQKEKALAAKLRKEQQRREINQKIKTLVKQYAVRDPQADYKRNFIFKERIRSVLVTREQIAEINSGALGVVYLRGNYHLMPMERIAEIQEFAADHIPDLKGAEPEGEDEHPVPDDLIW